MSQFLKVSNTTILRDCDHLAFNKENGCVSRLNESGYTILLHFIEPNTVDTVVTSISSIYGLEKEFVKSHVEEITQQLSQQGILELTI